MDQPLIVEETHSGVVKLILNRPEKHNAFDDNLIKLIYSTLEKLKRQGGLRLLTLTGKGESFSSGADLEWMRRIKNYSEEANYQDAKLLSHLLDSLDNFPCPTLACINGSAFGGGIGLIACCNIAISVENADFAFSEARIGLIPAVISPYVIKAIGLRLTQKLFLTAETFSAERAMQYGLIHATCPSNELETFYQQYESILLNNGMNALYAIKELIQLNERTTELDIKDLMVERIAATRVTDEAQEGLSAFLENRKPNWSKES